MILIYSWGMWGNGREIFFVNQHGVMFARDVQGQAWRIIPDNLLPEDAVQLGTADYKDLTIPYSIRRKMQMSPYYTTEGSVRGGCDHHHRTIAAAVACIERDHRDCRTSSGSTAYSDRKIVGVDNGRRFRIDADGE